MAVRLRILGLMRGVQAGGVLLIVVLKPVGRDDEVADVLLLLQQCLAL